MRNRIAICFIILALSRGGLAQELDLSHPLFQDEIKGWDYVLLMDCSVRYETAVGVYKSLSPDPLHFAGAIARWEHAQFLFFDFAEASAMTQGLSAGDVTLLHDDKSRQLLEPVEAAGLDKKALADVAVRYMNDAKATCAPYFDELKVRIELIEQQISKRRY